MMRTFIKPFVALLLSSSLLLPLAASAATTATSTSTGVTSKMQAAIGRADQEITRRVQALNDLNTRVGAMQRVTAQFKQTLASNIQTQIASLTQLQAKIDADTDAATLKTDIQSISQSYRIFALVVPQSRIAAAADRQVTLLGMLNTLGAKLQARIQAQQAAGTDVSKLLATLTDMGTKLNDANTQAQAAVSVSATLVPDGGDKTKMAANTAALKTARSDIQTAQQDLVTARKDAQTIIAGLKLNGGVGTSTASTTSAH